LRKAGKRKGEEEKLGREAKNKKNKRKPGTITKETNGTAID